MSQGVGRKVVVMVGGGGGKYEHFVKKVLQPSIQAPYMTPTNKVRFVFWIVDCVVKAVINDRYLNWRSTTIINTRCIFFGEPCLPHIQID